MAANRTLQVDQYGRLYAVVQVTQGGSPLSLVGYSAKMQIRSKKDSAVILAEYSTANGMLFVSGAAGQVIIDVPGTETQDLVNNGVYDLYAWDPGNSTKPLRVVEGNVLVSPSVTRPVP